ncbi:hypothetical protein HFX_1818 [Haloferax mediterranei ATCC 33500]|uniref:Uncharacterized protein n=2 Tax=Haloferax mediterranei (strain ATCC 33500 / DSM 1411 / JCM 8866 / NBRC 14739 / NCIMB 2177 / R-4) TaxID=523841 RepID=I3R5L1_HALMT|nr:hypothetical protein HFX_1818 [Haloferax mediterranei ATCC 33500]
MNTREDVAFLVGSESREAILRTLAVEPRRPTDLANICDCARETAQRTLAGFCDRGWVEKADGLYRLTPGGEMVYDRYQELRTTVERAERMREFLTNAGSASDDIPSSVLDQMNITTAVSNDPHAPLNRYLTVLGDEPVDQFRGVAPIVSRVFNESAEAVLGEHTQMELIVDQSVLERSRTAYPEAFERARDLDQFELRITDEDLEFGLLLVDGHGVVAAYDEHNNMVALVDGDEPEVISWVEELYESIHFASTPIDEVQSTGMME